MHNEKWKNYEVINEYCFSAQQVGRFGGASVTCLLPTLSEPE